MKLTLKNKNKKGGLFQFKKKSPAKTTNSPKQQSFTNKLRSKLSEFIGINVKLEKEVEQPSSKIMKYFKVWITNPKISTIGLFIIPLFILMLKNDYSDLKSTPWTRKWQVNTQFMKQYILLFSLLLIPYLYSNQSRNKLKSDLIDFFINLKKKLNPKKKKKLEYNVKILNFIDTIDYNKLPDEFKKLENKAFESSESYNYAVNYVRENYSDEKDQDLLIEIINQNIYFKKAKKLFKYLTIFSLSHQIMMIYLFLNLGSINKASLYPSKISFGGGLNYLNSKVSIKSDLEFHTIFFGMINFLDDKIKDLILPLISNTVDQIISFLQDSKVDPKRVLMFFLVNTVLMIFGLVFNKIKRQMKEQKNLNNMVITKK